MISRKYEQAAAKIRVHRSSVSANRSKTPTFVLELPLKVSAAEEHALQSRLEAARQVYNANLGESLRRLDLMRQSKLYAYAKSLPRKSQARMKAFSSANRAAEFGEYDLHAWTAQFTSSWIGEHLDSLTMQALSSRAFKAVQQYAFGIRGRPRFKSWGQLDTVEGKNNESGIRWRNYQVLWGGLVLTPIIDAGDPVIQHGLSSRVKYVRLVRRRLNGKVRFYTQLVCEGIPFQKPENPTGQGYVGLDIGPSTIAIVSEHEAVLAQFCAELKPRWREIRRLHRKLERQRRANNPQNYNPNGTIKSGRLLWNKSIRQRETQAKLAELQRRQAAYRKSLHGRLVNRVLGMGSIIQFEKLSYESFQRQFGRSVLVRAPGIFIEHLKRKAASAGVQINEFPTHSTRLSQTCHQCGAVAPKPLSQRWHACECGIVAQRDLYSAFLASCVDDTRLNADYAQQAWPGADTLLRAALSDLQLAKGGRLPASFGLSQRQSRSPVKSQAEPASGGGCCTGPGGTGTVQGEPPRALRMPGTPRT